MDSTALDSIVAKIYSGASGRLPWGAALNEFSARRRRLDATKKRRLAAAACNSNRLGNGSASPAANEAHAGEPHQQRRPSGRLGYADIIYIQGKAAAITEFDR